MSPAHARGHPIPVTLPLPMPRTSPFRLLAVLSLALGAATACSDTTGPATIDPAALEADLTAANSAVAAPAVLSFNEAGAGIDAALSLMGGGTAVVDLPAALLVNPKAVVERAELRARLLAAGGDGAAAIPAAALGATFEYDTQLGRYVKGVRTGAPANGVRFILYAVDPATREKIVPLVETGYVDLTRTVNSQSATARVEVWGGGTTLVKVLDYAATVSGNVVSPNILVAGFAKHGTDSLTFTLASSLSLANQSIDLDWRTALPSRSLTSRVQQTILGGTSPSVAIDGVLTSASGRVGISGTIEQATGGTLTVKVNGQTFATIAVTSAEDDAPVILNKDGEPLSTREQAVLRQVLEWFHHAFETYEALLRPVARLLDIAF
jgi:hypothetical protein